jgi:hypothetical protein
MSQWSQPYTRADGARMVDLLESEPWEAAPANARVIKSVMLDRAPGMFADDDTGKPSPPGALFRKRVTMVRYSKLEDRNGAMLTILCEGRHWLKVAIVKWLLK